MINVIGNFIGYTNQSAAETPLSETDENLAFSIRPDWLSTMLQEGGGADGVPLTAVAADDDPVGTLYDTSVNAMILRSEVSGAQPLLDSDAEVDSFLTFDGTNDKLVVLSSIGLCNPMWSTNPVFCIRIKIKFSGGDGVTQRIASSDDGLATNTGLNIVKGASNTIIARVPYSSSPNFVWTVTSTTTFTAASGWRYITISGNGVGAATGRFVVQELDGTSLEDKTFAIAGTGITANSTSNLTIGSVSGATPAGFLTGSIAEFKIWNTAVNDIILNAVDNPARKTTRFAPLLQYQYDMNDTTFIFSDAGGTTPVVADNAVRVIKNNKLGIFGHAANSRRNLSSTASASSPLWKSAAINSRGAILFDGTDDNLDFLNTFMEEQGGRNTLFLVAQNLDATNGSHILNGTDYVVITGSNYAGAPAEFTNPYMVVHNAFPDSIGINSKGSGVDGVKLIAYRRDGQDLSMWNGSKTKATDTSTARFIITDMGDYNSGPGANWRMHGYVCYLLKYNGVMTDAEVEAKIDELNTLFAI
jgi:hypothetical protein